MNPRERLLTTLRGGVADRTPLDLPGFAFTTREAIDAVRYLTNGSTGTMGLAIAEAALGPDHVSLAYPLRSLGVAHEALGELAAARA